jgi:hypothetical protein
MGHYAKVVDGIVVNVIKADSEFFETFIDDSPGEWFKTSYNTKGGKHLDPITLEEDDGIPLRKNFASIGFSYSKELDAFIPPKPYPSWILNEDTCLWESPVEPPELSSGYDWNEENQSWDPIEVE